MKRHALLLLVVALVSLVLASQVHTDTLKVRRVRLQVTNTTAFPSEFTVAAEGTEGVGGAGVDLLETEGAFCDIHFNKVTVDEDGDSAVLTGRVVEASNPANYGAFVKITAHSGSTATNGTVNFVFEAIDGGAKTGAAGINLTGTVKIVNVLP
jgi:hypothetical protein